MKKSVLLSALLLTNICVGGSWIDRKIEVEIDVRGISHYLGAAVVLWCGYKLYRYITKPRLSYGIAHEQVDTSSIVAADSTGKYQASLWDTTIINNILNNNPIYTGLNAVPKHKLIVICAPNSLTQVCDSPEEGVRIIYVKTQGDSHYFEFDRDGICVQKKKLL